MLAKNEMESDAYSWHYLSGCDEHKLKDIDRYILTNCRNLSKEDLRNYCSRIKALKVTGSLRCRSTPKGEETLGLTKDGRAYLRVLEH